MAKTVSSVLHRPRRCKGLLLRFHVAASQLRDCVRQSELFLTSPRDSQLELRTRATATPELRECAANDADSRNRLALFEGLSFAKSGRIANFSEKCARIPSQPSNHCADLSLLASLDATSTSGMDPNMEVNDYDFGLPVCRTAFFNAAHARRTECALRAPLPAGWIGAPGARIFCATR